jgi:uncharacterized protein YodC (DUF2158 family)
MAQFSTGDIVQLKSGGPKMTVKGESNVFKGQYDWQWFGGKKLERGSFPADSLQSAPADEKSQ